MKKSLLVIVISYLYIPYNYTMLSRLYIIAKTVMPYKNRAPFSSTNFNDLPFKFKVISSSMFGSKTSRLIKYLNLYTGLGYQCQAFKHSHDISRGGEYQLQTHDKITYPATSIECVSHILKHLKRNTQIVAFDEAQFASPKELLKTIIEFQKKKHTTFMIAGLDLDRHGIPWESMMLALAYADHIEKPKANCGISGIEGRGRYTVLKNSDTKGKEVLIGGSDLYTACAPQHFNFDNDHLQKYIKNLKK